MIKNFLPNKNSKIAIGLSGGVDSALAASLLKEKGYDLVGVHVELWSDPPSSTYGETSQNCNAYCGNELEKTAQDTAKLLRIPFYKIDLKDEFKTQVIDKIVQKYRLSLTPNPCILCNKFVRFGALLQTVLKKHNCDYLATGHYARIFKQKNQVHLVRAKDLKKDQSYFLSRLEHDQLNHLVFPLGDWHKKDVWQEAKKRQLPAVKSKESFDVCFTKDLDNFLKKSISNFSKGEVITKDGQLIGKHKGLPFYTIGSRGGWDWLPHAQKKLSKDSDLPKLYVIGKNKEKNQLVVGDKKEAMTKKFTIYNLQFTSKSNSGLFVKIRNTGKLLECELKGKKVLLKKPEFGITPGQTAVFYQPFKNDFEVVGWGEIGI